MGDAFHTLVHFSGHVQGVGFRYSTLQVAKEFEVAGYVSNLADGRVRVEVEGEESEVKAFIIKFLGWSGDERALPVLIGHLSNPETADMAAQALSMWSLDPAYRQALLRLDHATGEA